MNALVDNQGRKMLPWPRNPQYLVREDGVIIDRRRGPVTTYNARGYLEVELRPDTSRDGLQIQSKKRYKAHIVVCETFHGPRPDGTQVAHEDGDKRNNSAANLTWKTPKENAADQIRLGRQARGETSGKSKLTEDDVRKIRQRWPEQTHAELADEFGVHINTISNVITRRTWAHV